MSTSSESPRLPVAGAGRPAATTPRPAGPSTPAGDERPTCGCGHDRHHHAVSAKPTFGLWAWLALMMGISGRPKKITYVCRRCGQVVEVTKDPADLRAFR